MEAPTARRIALLSDTNDPRAVAAHVDGADLLVHEATAAFLREASGAPPVWAVCSRARPDLPNALSVGREGGEDLRRHREARNPPRPLDAADGGKVRDAHQREATCAHALRREARAATTRTRTARAPVRQSLRLMRRFPGDGRGSRYIMDQVLRGAEKHFDGEVLAARDFMRLQLHHDGALDVSSGLLAEGEVSGLDRDLAHAEATVE